MTINEYLGATEAWLVTAALLGAIFWVLTTTSLFAGHAIARGEARLGLMIWLVPTILSGWATVALTVTLSMPLNFAVLAPLALVPILVGTVASYLPGLRGLLRGIPAHWLIVVQAYRVVGIVFLVPFHVQGIIGAGFAYPAAIGDVITGLAALPVAWLVWKDPARHAKLFYAWTLFGIADLVVAVTTARVFGFETTPNGLTFSIATVPLFLGPPFGILIHVLTWRCFRLRSTTLGCAPGKASGRGKMPTWDAEVSEISPKQTWRA